MNVAFLFRMLEDLSGRVDSTEDKLGRAMGKLKDFVAKSEGTVLSFSRTGLSRIYMCINDFTLGSVYDFQQEALDGVFSFSGSFLLSSCWSQFSREIMWDDIASLVHTEETFPNRPTCTVCLEPSWLWTNERVLYDLIDVWSIFDFFKEINSLYTVLYTIRNSTACSWLVRSYSILLFIVILTISDGWWNRGPVNSLNEWGFNPIFAGRLYYPFSSTFYHVRTMSCSWWLVGEKQVMSTRNERVVLLVPMHQSRHPLVWIGLLCFLLHPGMLDVDSTALLSLSSTRSKVCKSIAQ